MHCTGLVSEVSKHPFFATRFNPHIFTRCQALKGNLNSDLSQFPRTRALTKGLIETLQEKALWGDYGIVSAVVVRPMHSLSPVSTTHF